MRTVKNSQGIEYIATNVLIPIGIHSQARSLGINMSRVCSSALESAVRTCEGSTLYAGEYA